MKPTYNFYARLDKTNKQGKAPIYLRVTYNRKKSLFNTGIKIEKKFWNQSKQLVRQNHPASKMLNQELEDLLLRVQGVGFKLGKQHRLSATNIVDRLKGVNPENLFQYAERFCERLTISGSVRRSKQTKVLINKLRKLNGTNYLEFTMVVSFPSFRTGQK